VIAADDYVLSTCRLSKRARLHYGLGAKEERATSRNLRLHTKRPAQHPTHASDRFSPRGVESMSTTAVAGNPP
jgi:hypothetical protein